MPGAGSPVGGPGAWAPEPNTRGDGGVSTTVNHNCAPRLRAKRPGPGARAGPKDRHKSLGPAPVLRRKSQAQRVAILACLQNAAHAKTSHNGTCGPGPGHPGPTPARWQLAAGPGGDQRATGPRVRAAPSIRNPAHTPSNVSAGARATRPGPLPGPRFRRLGPCRWGPIVVPGAGPGAEAPGHPPNVCGTSHLHRADCNIARGASEPLGPGLGKPKPAAKAWCPALHPCAWLHSAAQAWPGPRAPAASRHGPVELRRRDPWAPWRRHATRRRRNWTPAQGRNRGAIVREPDGSKRYCARPGAGPYLRTAPGMGALAGTAAGCLFVPTLQRPQACPPPALTPPRPDSRQARRRGDPAPRQPKRRAPLRFSAGVSGGGAPRAPTLRRPGATAPRRQWPMLSRKRAWGGVAALRASCRRSSVWSGTTDPRRHGAAARSPPNSSASARHAAGPAGHPI